MVKLVKKFVVGDKVFAKVRGYPPWPAKVSLITHLFYLSSIIIDVSH